MSAKHESRTPLHVDREFYISDIPAECIADCSGPGPADEAVAFWRRELGFTVDRTRATRYLKGYGAWEPEELAAKSDEGIAEIVLWLACGTFSEWNGTADSPCGSDIFSLDE